MIQIRLCGGLGNQLFGFALGLAFSAQSRIVKYDVTLLDQDPARRFLLNDFGWHMDVVRENAPITVQEKSLCFDPEILELKGDQVLNGYWQNEKYFEHLANYIRGFVFLRTKFSARTLEVAQQIMACGARSCFVHVRRSDNLRESSTLYHGLTDTSAPYYDKAIDLAFEKIPDIHYFVFSDDPEWCKRAASDWNKITTLVSHNAPSFTEDESHNLHKTTTGREVEDLYLMSLCRHAIIANSTFGWWGAWLQTPHEGQIVIAPDPWYNTDEAGPTEIIPERWEKVAR